jgi:hypothetical protein
LIQKICWSRWSAWPDDPLDPEASLIQTSWKILPDPDVPPSDIVLPKKHFLLHLTLVYNYY